MGGGLVSYNHLVHPQQQPSGSAASRNPKVESPEKQVNDFSTPPILNTSELIAGMSLTNLDVNTGVSERPSHDF